MNDAMLRSILLRLDTLEAMLPKMRGGIVTDDSPLAVALGGSDVPYTDCKRLASYTPTIGDRVQAVLWGNDLIVLDKIA